MKLINVKLEKIRNSLFIKIPDLISESLHLKDGEDIEISIHSEPSFAQGELWGDKNSKSEEVVDFFLDISDDLHTINMYNRMYMPEKYRFFFPASNIDFYLLTNIGQIKTHINSNGYFIKGLRPWIQVNGPLEAIDKIHFKILDDHKKIYEMSISN